MQNIELLKYPIGNYSIPETVSEDKKLACISSIKKLPYDLEKSLSGLSQEQVDTPYRPEGWTVRQLIHHIADSHMNAFTRFKLGMTEDKPTIRPYDQEAWCNMSDAGNLEPSASIDIIRGIHRRWAHVLESMTAEDYQRTIFHPEMKKEISLLQLLTMYGWHSDHHLAHVTGLIERNNW